MFIREYTPADLPAMTAIWNAIVEAGDAFPQEEPLDEATGAAFFASQTRSAVRKVCKSSQSSSLHSTIPPPATSHPSPSSPSSPRSPKQHPYENSACSRSKVKGLRRRPVKPSVSASWRDSTSAVTR